MSNTLRNLRNYFLNFNNIKIYYCVLVLLFFNLVLRSLYVSFWGLLDLLLNKLEINFTTLRKNIKSLYCIVLYI